RKADSARGIDKSAAPGFQHLLQVHAETQRHYRGLQQEPCERPSRRKWVREAEPESYSEGQRNRRRNQPAARKDECQKKNYFDCRAASAAVRDALRRHELIVSHPPLVL